MSEARLRQSVENLGRALERLEEALAVPLDHPLAVDGTIQRFEFALDVLVTDVDGKDGLVNFFGAGRIVDAGSTDTGINEWTCNVWKYF